MCHRLIDTRRPQLGLSHPTTLSSTDIIITNFSKSFTLESLPSHMQQQINPHASLKCGFTISSNLLSSSSWSPHLSSHKASLNKQILTIDVLGNMGLCKDKLSSSYCFYSGLLCCPSGCNKLRLIFLVTNFLEVLELLRMENFCQESKLITFCQDILDPIDFNQIDPYSKDSHNENIIVYIRQLIAL